MSSLKEDDPIIARGSISVSYGVYAEFPRA